jgi:hypothetical protein
MPPSRGRPPNRRATQKRGNQRQIPEPPLGQHKKLRLIWSVAKGVAVFLATAVGLILGFWGAIGPPWPVAPEIRPTGCDSTDPFLLPFSIRNPSALFSLTATGFLCDAFNIRLPDNTRIADLHSGRSGPVDISPGQVVNFTCSVKAPPNSVSVEAQRVRVKYDDIISKGNEHASAIYNFMHTSAGCQWIEGSTVREISLVSFLARMLHIPQIYVRSNRTIRVFGAGSSAFR